MPTRRIFPNSDAVPNDMTPTPSGDHYAQVDEYPNDGDTTRLRVNLQGDLEAFGIDASAIGLGETIESVTLRAAIEVGGTDISVKLGFRIGGTYYMSAAVVIGTTAGYAEITPAAWTTNPATGLAWSRAALAAAYLVFEVTSYDEMSLPHPKVSAFDGYATTTDLPDRPTSTAVSMAPAATAADPGKPTATAAAQVPTATAVILTRTATAQAITPKGTAS